MTFGRILLALGGLALTTAAAPAQTSKPGDVLTIALNSDIRSVDASRRDANTDTVLHHLYETLVAYRNDFTVGPALADSWDISADGRTYTFHLRPGATYHNGDKVVASDIKWLWERRMSPALGGANPWFCSAYFDGSQGLKVTSVNVIDDATIAFNIDEPNALFLIQLANIACNIWAASPKNVGPDGKWIENSAIGSGPFKLREWRKERQVLLERYAGYSPSKKETSGYSGERKALVNEVSFLVVPDKSAAEAALLAGQIDVLPTVPAQRIADIKRRGAMVMSAPGLSWSAILMQTKDPLLSNVKLRRAIAHALDLKQIAAVKTDGLAEFNPSGVAQSTQFFDSDFQKWPAYDAAAAKTLLKEAGYKGETLTIQTNTRYTGMYDNAVLIQAMLATVGINSKLEVLDWAAQLDNYLAGRFQIQSFGYSALVDPTLRYGGIMGDKTKDATSQWNNKEAYALYLDSMKTSDAGQRRTIFKKIHALMAVDVPIQGLYYTPVVDAVSPKVSGYAVWPADKPRAWGVEKR